MLKKDGILVYSTCSLNPIEDEAVIASLLNSAEGGAQLEDVSNVLPNLKFCNGLEKWTVMTREMVVVNSVDEVEDKYKSQIRESLFPPKNADKLNLKRCLRILPHLQNTGGFFVAVIKKTVDTLPWETSNQSIPIVEEQNKVEERLENSERPRKRRRARGYKEDPFIFIDENESDWPKIKY
jgi:tRNA (cytosine34-C5)-methyltransferase